MGKTCWISSPRGQSKKKRGKAAPPQRQRINPPTSWGRSKFAIIPMRPAPCTREGRQKTSQATPPRNSRTAGCQSQCRPSHRPPCPSRRCSKRARQPPCSERRWDHDHDHLPLLVLSLVAVERRRRRPLHRKPQRSSGAGPTCPLPDSLHSSGSNAKLKL